MNIFKHFLSLLCLLICTLNLSSQEEACFVTGSSLNLSTLDFAECSGVLTYNITGAGLNCTDCTSPIDLNSSGVATVTAFSAGMECDEITIQIIDTPSIVLTSSGSANCNEYQFTGSSSENIADWSWDFNSDGVEDANGQSGTFFFTANGNQQITLTTTAIGGCQSSTTIDQFIDGPWAELSVSGEVGGVTNTLPEFSFNSLNCVISYCVLSLENDHTITLFDVPHTNSTGANISYSHFKWRSSI